MGKAQVLVALLGLAACAAPSLSDGDGAGSAIISGGLSGAFVETTGKALPAQPCGPGNRQGCSSNNVVVADLDGDGHLDLVFANGGGHFVPGTAEPAVVYLGDGKSGFRDSAALFADPIVPSRVRQAVVGDIDGDGFVDLYLPGGFGQDDDQLFMGSAYGFHEEAAKRLPADALRSRAGGAHLGDLDNDGDLDLVVIDWGIQPNPDAPDPSAVTVHVLINDGHGVFTHGATLDGPGGSSATDVDLQDLDGDLSLDLVLTNRNGQSRIYLNDGAGTLVDRTEANAFPPKQGGFSFNAEACDVDGDGHLDLLFDGAASALPGHDTQLLINDGKGHFTDQTEKRIKLEATSDDNQVKCVDVDNDGDFDLVVASLSNRSEKLFLNDGTGFFAEAVDKMPAVLDPTLGIDCGDFDGDGRVDCVTAQGENPALPFLNRIYKNGLAVAKDTRPPRFRSVEMPSAHAGVPTVLRMAVTDAHTSETGQHVRSVQVDVTAGYDTTTVSARFVGGDVFRAVLPALPAGAIMTLTPRATDRQGNAGAGTPIRVVVAP